MAAISGGLLTIREPLWIDELHTAWVCQGDFSNVAERASFGNQSPFWFWIEAAIWKLLNPSWNGSATSALRLLSLCCWCAAFAVIGAWTYRHSRRTLVVAALGWLLYCDQINWFYANEARPYAAVALFTTLAAMHQFRMFTYSATLQRIGYIFFAVAAVYTHYTSIVTLAALLVIDVGHRCVAFKRQELDDATSFRWVTS